MTNDNPIAVSALQRKRAEIAGIIAELEKRIAEHRADLVHIDNALRLMNSPIAGDATYRLANRARATRAISRTASCPAASTRPYASARLSRAPSLPTPRLPIRALTTATFERHSLRGSSCA